MFSVSFPHPFTLVPSFWLLSCFCLCCLLSVYLRSQLSFCSNVNFATSFRFSFLSQSCSSSVLPVLGPANLDTFKLKEQSVFGWFCFTDPSLQMYLPLFFVVIKLLSDHSFFIPSERMISQQHMSSFYNFLLMNIFPLERADQPVQHQDQYSKIHNEFD